MSILAEVFSAGTSVTVDVAVLGLMIGTLIPIVTRVITNSNASSSLKSIVNLVLSVLAGGAAALLQANGTLTLVELITAMGAVFLSSGVSYSHLWKPTGVTEAIGNKTASFGIGGSTSESGV